MIDEKRLDEFEQNMNKLDTDFPALPRSKFLELLRLARLGLWAEKHMETFKALRQNLMYSEEGRWIEEALAALPKPPR